jgi:hypothetical protein
MARLTDPTDPLNVLTEGKYAGGAGSDIIWNPTVIQYAEIRKEWQEPPEASRNMAPAFGIPQEIIGGGKRVMLAGVRIPDDHWDEPVYWRTCSTVVVFLTTENLMVVTMPTSPLSIKTCQAPDAKALAQLTTFKEAYERSGVEAWHHGTAARLVSMEVCRLLTWTHYQSLANIARATAERDQEAERALAARRSRLMHC